MERKFAICEVCGNLVGMIHDSGVPMVCCGKPMEMLEPNTKDASKEKHVPVVGQKGDTVEVDVGSAEHPMLLEHNIQWVYLQTDKGGHRKNLRPEEAPKAQFVLKDETPLRAYAYCNLHGLWAADIK